ncbi:RidA family protein [Natronospirillum operosum]|uniref:RidA family protein n=1 Tax=Natronospirillum operosum TaxID=2759953 RepID=A0A4Z0WCV5_9GAMM|nr:RidA family protein [Natronospirillum operosum]TGG92830.1 RidA family protein [Natronospirillum operosum]
MSIRNINPAALYDGAASGLSHARVDTLNGLVFVSGQVDWNTDFGVVHESIEEQTEAASKNLLTVLGEASSSVDDLLQLRVYVRGELSDHMEAVVPILVKYLGRARPALTGVGVASLASPDLLIEIEAIARVSAAAL